MAGLKALVGKILFGDAPRMKFVPVKLAPEEIQEKVFIVNGNDQEEISFDHCIVCHDPFLVATLSEGTKLEVRRNGKLCADAHLRFKHRVDSILVYEIISTRSYQLPYWRQYILQKRYFLRGKKDTFLQGMIYAAMYAFPRRVIAVSYKDDSYFNIFPMDFQCYIEKKNMMLFGLRTTNTTLKKILLAKKLVVSDTTSVDFETIYDLGRNHSAAPPAIDQLPFGVMKSEKFGFWVPEFSATYKELEIVNSVELGTHTMMVGRVVNYKKIRDEESYLHHVHFFEFGLINSQP